MPVCLVVWQRCITNTSVASWHMENLDTLCCLRWCYLEPGEHGFGAHLLGRPNTPNSVAHCVGEHTPCMHVEKAGGQDATYHVVVCTYKDKLCLHVVHFVSGDTLVVPAGHRDLASSPCLPLTCEQRPQACASHRVGKHPIRVGKHPIHIPSHSLLREVMIQAGPYQPAGMACPVGGPALPEVNACGSRPAVVVSCWCLLVITSPACLFAGWFSLGGW